MAYTDQGAPGAPLSNLLGGLLGIGGTISQDANGNWITTTTNNEGIQQTQNLQDQMTPAQWSQIQAELSKGQLDLTSTGTLSADPNKLPKILGTIDPGFQFMSANMGGGFTSLPGTQAGGPQNTANLVNPKAVQWDPNYGWITSASNEKSSDDWFNKVGGVIGDIAPTALMLAMSAAFGGPLAGLAGAPGFGGSLVSIANILGSLGQSGGTVSPFGGGSTPGGTTGNATVQAIMKILQQSSGQTPATTTTGLFQSPNIPGRATIQ
jgi:hypothetical protein